MGDFKRFNRLMVKAFQDQADAAKEIKGKLKAAGDEYTPEEQKQLLTVANTQEHVTKSLYTIYLLALKGLNNE